MPTDATARQILGLGMKAPARVYLRILIAAALGAGYGLWGLEAASPLAIPLILWAVMVLLLIWRIPIKPGPLVACVCAFLAGFGAVWTVVLGQLLASCKPPSCQTADAPTDLFYAGALLVPLLIAGSALIVVRKVVLRR